MLSTQKEKTKTTFYFSNTTRRQPEGILPLISAFRKQTEVYKFKDSLVYLMSPWPTRTTLRLGAGGGREREKDIIVLERWLNN